LISLLAAESQPADIMTHYQCIQRGEVQGNQQIQICCTSVVFCHLYIAHLQQLIEEEEGFYKFLPANTADRLCQLWQSCSNHHEI